MASVLMLEFALLYCFELKVGCACKCIETEDCSGVLCCDEEKLVEGKTLDMKYYFEVAVCGFQ